MTCLRDGNLTICGGFRKRNCYYFSENFKEVLFCDSLWYGPNLVGKLKRKKYERIDLFKARVLEKLGFMPRTHRGWWRFIAMPQIKAMNEDRKEEAKKNESDGYAPCLEQKEKRP